MKKTKRNTGRRGGMQLVTLIISTTMVLTLLGLVVLSVLTARNLSTYMRENVTVNVVLGDTVSVVSGKALGGRLELLPYAKVVTYISKDEALAVATKEMGADPTEFAGVNPFQAELDIQMRAEYANSDSLRAIAQGLLKDSRVVDVVYTKEQIDSMNRLLRPVNIGLLSLAALLIFICYTLISNSVQLSVYARRFLIHTMKLVGAPWSFIRRPFVRQAIGVGIVSALLTCVLLGVVVYVLYPYVPAIDVVVTWRELAITAACVFVFGFVIMVLCTCLSVNKFLRMTAGELYKI